MRKLQAVTSEQKAVPARRRPVAIRTVRLPRATFGAARRLAAVALPQRFVDGDAWDEV